MIVLINGKQKQVRRPPTMNGMDVYEFILKNADPIFLLQNEIYEELYEWEQENSRER